MSSDKELRSDTIVEISVWRSQQEAHAAQDKRDILYERA